MNSTLESQKILKRQDGPSQIILFMAKYEPMKNVSMDMESELGIRSVTSLDLKQNLICGVMGGMFESEM